MKAYKITNKYGKCRGHQYEVGKTYKYEGEIEICKSGFHACRNPMDCMKYQDISQARYFEVLLQGEIIHGDNKSVCSEITIVRELQINEYIDECIKYKDGQLASSGNHARLASRENGAQLVSSGTDARLASSGYGVGLVSSGTGAWLASSGPSTQLVSSGDYARLASSGDHAQLASRGDCSIVAGVGYKNRVKVDKRTSWIVLSEYDREGQVKRVHAKKPGQKINGVTIKTGHWYWFEDGELKEEKEK